LKINHIPFLAFCKAFKINKLFFAYAKSHSIETKDLRFQPVVPAAPEPDFHPNSTQLQASNASNAIALASTHFALANQAEEVYDSKKYLTKAQTPVSFTVRWMVWTQWLVSSHLKT
jgi:hypothetical protein